jgi:hypothetical protein
MHLETLMGGRYDNPLAAGSNTHSGIDAGNL